MGWYNVDIRSNEEKEKQMNNIIVLNTVSDLANLLDTTDMPTFVNRVAFAGDLLDMVRSTGNEIAIDENVGRCDDGGWIRIDDIGYVVEDFAIL
jgi:hypothetical protein